MNSQSIIPYKAAIIVLLMRVLSFCFHQFHIADRTISRMVVGFIPFTFHRAGIDLSCCFIFACKYHFSILSFYVINIFCLQYHKDTMCYLSEHYTIMDNIYIFFVFARQAVFSPFPVRHLTAVTGPECPPHQI